ncbi:MAG: 16S rRNA (cytosine(1402)-N(4))-methyltransferase, partial [Clostridia bacterium]|nr:16S rRNA (cytosine(1402)-N(4))-methyltransferase [Clostridia bacterium]
LRLDPSSGVTAAQRLRELSEDDLIGLFMENSDEPYAVEIARGIFEVFESGGVIETTRQLYDVVEKTLNFLPKKDRKDVVRKSCQRVFQALRIEVNSEFEVLYAFLEKLPNVLAPGGRAAILTFHSGEDRLVKQAFKQGVRDGVYSDAARDVIRPSAEECAQNPRATSTKMRWAIKA